MKIVQINRHDELCDCHCRRNRGAKGAPSLLQYWAGLFQIIFFNYANSDCICTSLRYQVISTACMNIDLFQNQPQGSCAISATSSSLPIELRSKSETKRTFNNFESLSNSNASEDKLQCHAHEWQPQPLKRLIFRTAESLKRRYTFDSLHAHSQCCWLSHTLTAVILTRESANY